MAARRIRPTRPLAPHGLPGHLVGFVEALRGAGISVGPSETVDAGRVMATLGLGNREVLAMDFEPRSGRRHSRTGPTAPAPASTRSHGPRNR